MTPATATARESAARPDRRALWALLAIVTLFTLLFLNWRHPVVRTTSVAMNLRIGVGMCLLPWLAALVGTRLPIGPSRWMVAGVFALGGVLLLPFAFFAAVSINDIVANRDTDGGFLPVSQVAFGASAVIAYETNGGATTDFGLVVRHERPIGPGVLLVRNLYEQYHAKGGVVTRAGPMRVRVFPDESTVAAGEFVVRPWVWF